MHNVVGAATRKSGPKQCAIVHRARINPCPDSATFSSDKASRARRAIKKSRGSNHNDHLANYRSPLCVVFDSASATSVLDFLHWLISSGDELVSILSCFMFAFMSSPSSKLEEVKGEDEARLFGVDDAAPSTHRSPGAGNLGDAGGGV